LYEKNKNKNKNLHFEKNSVLEVRIGNNGLGILGVNETQSRKTTSSLASFDKV
jgi:hypothetical protein